MSARSAHQLPAPSNQEIIAGIRRLRLCDYRSASGRLYVIDEAQNFAPSGAKTACKASAISR